MARNPGVERNDQIGHYDDMPTCLPSGFGFLPWRNEEIAFNAFSIARAVPRCYATESCCCQENQLALQPR